MRLIPLPGVDATVIFDKIAAAKQQPRKGRMQEARTRVLAAYQTYVDAAPEVGELDKSPLTDQQKAALQHAFIVETKPMTALRSDLFKESRVARCPFCSISESSTLDHYLPKEQYPEFSIFPNNLVPSCAVCNTHKLDRILAPGTNMRMFLHPYYDAIPDLAFLEVHARMEADALILSYRLIQPAGMAVQTFRHLRSHFNELDLADRYRRMGLEHLGGQYPALKRAYGVGEDAARVAEKLIEEAANFEEVFGPNYWLAKLYRALAGNGDFCDGGFEAIRV